MRRDKIMITLENQDIEQFREYLFERENSSATIVKYTADIRTFYKFLQEGTTVEKSTVINYKEWLLEHYAPASVNSMLVALNQFLMFLGASELRGRRIRVQKQMFSRQEKELTREEYNRLVKAAKDTGKYKLALLIETVCATGIRISELSYFTLEAVKKGKIVVSNKGKVRQILIPDTLRKKLLYFAQKEHIEKGVLFITKNGKPKNRSNIWAEMKKLYKASGIAPEKIFPHNLRHLFARVYYQMTRDIVGLADILGHSSLDTTRIYMSSGSEIYKKRFEKMKLIN